MISKPYETRESSLNTKHYKPSKKKKVLMDGIDIYGVYINLPEIKHIQRHNGNSLKTGGHEILRHNPHKSNPKLLP